jgi:hypothetical protein
MNTAGLVRKRMVDYTDIEAQYHFMMLVSDVWRFQCDTNLVTTRAARKTPLHEGLDTTSVISIC